MTIDKISVEITLINLDRVIQAATAAKEAVERLQAAVAQIEAQARIPATGPDDG